MNPAPTIIHCCCGTAYERREAHLPIKDIGLFECFDCGTTLEIWSGRNVPFFTRLEMRDAKRA